MKRSALGLGIALLISAGDPAAAPSPEDVEALLLLVVAEPQSALLRARTTIRTDGSFASVMWFRGTAEQALEVRYCCTGRVLAEGAAVSA